MSDTDDTEDTEDAGPAVLLEIDDGVAVVTLDRPELNVFDLTMRDEFITAVTAVRDHPDARALLLRANGRHFSAGADLSEFGTADFPLEARRIRWDRDPWGPLWDLPQPSVVALHGHAVGAGLEMALLCDLRLADPTTRLGLPETKLGMLPAAGGTQSLTRAIGADAALPIVATGRTLDAEEAAERGIVHAVVDDVERQAVAVAKRLASIDPVVATAARRAVHAAGDLPLAEGLIVERDLAAWAAHAATLPGSAPHRPNRRGPT